MTLAFPIPGARAFAPAVVRLHLALLVVLLPWLGGCRTSPAIGQRDPVVAPRDWTPGAVVSDADCRCVTWRCGPERGRLWRRWRVELEAGPLWQSRNDAAIPGDTGTRFALDDVTGAGAFPCGRVTVDYQISQRHGLRALVAPFSLEERGVLGRDVSFRGKTFSAGVPTEASYRFNSYRLTYRYLWGCGCDWSLHVGGTLKIRDAEIGLRQGAVRETKYDVGLVPLLHLAFEKRLSPRWRFVGDLDFAAAPQGRALDFAAKLHYDLDDRWSLGIGYRTIEGGADNDSVYTFSWFHQALLSATYRF